MKRRTNELTMYTEKVRLYPTKDQILLIDRVLWECKEFYNKALESDKEYYQQHGKGIGGKSKRIQFYEKIRKETNFQFAPAQAVQQTYRRLLKAFENFFNPSHGSYKRHPKFKSFHKFRSIVFPQVGGTNCRVNLDLNNIWCSKIGSIRAKFTRPLEGRPKQVILKKMKTNEYYAFIMIDDENRGHRRPIIRNEFNSGSIGIDLGVEKFLVTSDGKKLSRPRFTNRHERNQLRRAQRKLSRTTKGSERRNKARTLLAKLHEHIANQRRDHHFKVAHWLVHSYETICVENLKLRPLLRKAVKKSKLLRKLLSSVAFYEFMNILKYMSDKYQAKYIGVDPRNTSQTCSNCGTLVPKDLGVRVHSCPHCGVSIDRDLNAARNIHFLGTGIQHGTVGITETITLTEIVVPGI